MKVLTICNKCSSEEDEKKGIMKEEGPLYRNGTFKTESQNYKCSDCGNEITVAIDWAWPDGGAQFMKGRKEAEEECINCHEKFQMDKEQFRLHLKMGVIICSEECALEFVRKD